MIKPNMIKFDLNANFPDKAWLEETARKLDDKMQYAVKKANEVDYIPYTTENGQWKKNDIRWWTNGFWGGILRLVQCFQDY